MEGCDRDAKTRGWCRAHYQRWYKTGDPLGVRPQRWDGYTRPTCTVDGCERPAHARGLCTVHGPRERRHGDPTAGRRLQATGGVADRFASFTMVAPGGCHVWTGARTSAGYPEFTVGGVTSYAHRWAYEHAVGPVPDGYDVHHICRNHACVNVDHLEALTRRAHAALHRKARA